MSAQAVVNHAGKVLHICGCCNEAEGTRPDAELHAMVCEDCNTQLRHGQARLKLAEIRGCAPDKEVEFREDAA